ncbi:MAG: PA2169 family four-helix-bundle protein, partial [Mucilaginibacter polytrichastri]|nr:PA2169 family four-helix-bundle protein [Mucilaginibacter polytrichastri]
RAWIDVKATFTGSDRKSILEEAERGEDAIKKAYRDALAPESELPAEVVNTVSRQAEEQKAAHDRIKALRDSQ